MTRIGTRSARIQTAHGPGAEPDEYKYLVQEAMRLSDLLLTFTLLTNRLDAPGANAAVEMLRSAEAAPGMQVGVRNARVGARGPVGLARVAPGPKDPAAIDTVTESG